MRPSGILVFAASAFCAIPIIADAAAPIGYLDSVGENGAVVGWAIDPDNPSQPLTINLYLDDDPGNGRLVGTTTANMPRRDINRATGFAGNHGFSLTVPPISDDRVRRLSAYAVDSSGGGAFLAGSGKLFNITDNTILGTYNMAPEALPGAISIAGSFKGSPIVITTANAFAGAIFSLTWNGRQFINNFDHGRELQSAAFYDGYVECLNPTEAGSGADGQNLDSTSRLLSASAAGNVLRTQTQMAYWARPGGESGHCGSAKTAVNTTVLSSDVLSKTVTIGFGGMPNVIEHQITFKVSEPHASALFQAVNGYMPASFSKFWSYNPATGKLLSLPAVYSASQGFPVILATADGSYAMGVYSPDEPQTPKVQYERWNYSGGAGDATNKWVCLFAETNLTARDYNYRCYSIIGTLNDVRDSLTKLYAYFGSARGSPSP